MFRITTKTDYWQMLENKLVPDTGMGLKSIQDGFALSEILKSGADKVLEVGGGANSRVLGRIRANKECWNAEKTGNNATGRIQHTESIDKIEGVRHVEAYLGEFSAKLPDDYFDFVFSVSVLEHVPTENLGEFFKDCIRILRPGGIMLHAADVYLLDPGDTTVWSANIKKRLSAYLDELDKLPAAFVEPPQAEAGVRASARWASNTDLVLHGWNNHLPQGKRLRAAAQSANLAIMMRKSGS